MNGKRVCRILFVFEEGQELPDAKFRSNFDIHTVYFFFFLHTLNSRRFFWMHTVNDAFCMFCNANIRKFLAECRHGSACACTVNGVTSGDYHR
jgi:hypothetical protein